MSIKFDFKESLEKRAIVAQEKQHSNISDEFTKLLTPFETSYKEWYQRSTELGLQTDVKAFLQDTGFTPYKATFWETMYERKDGVYFEVVSRDFLKQENISGDVIYMSHKFSWVYLNLHKGVIKETTNPLPF